MANDNTTGVDPFPVQDFGNDPPLPQDQGITPYVPEPGQGTPFDDDGNLSPGWELVDGEPTYVGFAQPQQPADDPYSGAFNQAIADDRVVDQGTGVDPYSGAFNQAMADDRVLPGNAEASGTLAKVNAARYSNPASKQIGQSSSNKDWRLKISLAKNANYLYKIAKPGELLEPLKGTQGVIFPYTPSVSTSYKANYSPYDLTHSNYKGYFYSSSAVEAISVKGVFTAQNFQEAKYLLATIHFFKSVTKMFYGARDPNAGSPPPVLYMSGFGEYQFNNHPVVMSSFDYQLPTDVDYIRTTIPQDNINRQVERNRSNTVYSPQFAGLIRLGSALNIFGQPIPKGAIFTPPNPARSSSAATYVPTKIDISITLLPVQSRKQVSQQFNMQDFANGNLIKKGFW